MRSSRAALRSLPRGRNRRRPVGDRPGATPSKTHALVLEEAMSRCFSLVEKTVTTKRSSELTGLRQCGLPGVAVQVALVHPRYHFHPR
jgi:hypothetical protein